MSIHASIIGRCIKCHYVQSTEQATLQRTSNLSRRQGWGADTQLLSYIIITLGPCRRSQQSGTDPPSCLQDDLRDYWHLACEAGVPGSQACIKMVFFKHQLCLCQETLEKSHRPGRRTSHCNFYPTNSKMCCPWQAVPSAQSALPHLNYYCTTFKTPLRHHLVKHPPVQISHRAEG